MTSDSKSGFVIVDDHRLLQQVLSGTQADPGEHGDKVEERAADVRWWRLSGG